MADVKNFNNLDLQGLSVKNFKCSPMTTVDRTALVLGLSDDGRIVWDTTLKALYVWNGTAWQNADKDEEVLVVVADPTVTVPSNLTAGTNLIYSSATGFLYHVADPVGTPVITKIGDNIVNLGSATTFNPLLIDTTQFNDAGEIWLVDDNGTAIVLSDGVDEIFAEWTNYSLVVGDNLFDITGTSGTPPTVTDYKVGQVVPTKSLLKNSVTVDVADEEVTIVKKSVNQTQFIVNSSIATVGTITVQTVGK